MGKAFDPFLILKFLPLLVSYLPVTLFILILSITGGLLIGFLAALPRIYKLPILGPAASVYISFMRGTPILIQLFLVYYGLPAVLQFTGMDLSRMNPVFFVVLTYSLNCGAVFSEIIRGGVNSVESGQEEAAFSIGMSTRQAFLRIVLPQALIMSFPNFGNTVIGFLKDTSLAFTIGVVDMLGRGDSLIASTSHALEVYISLSVIYYLIAILLEKGFKLTENRLQRHNPSLTVSADQAA